MTTTVAAPPSKKEAKKLAKTEAVDGEAPKSKKKLLIVVLVAVLALGGGGWFMFLKPAGPPKPPEPGAVVSLEPIQINLAGGHYLKLGIALQATIEAKEAPDGSKALDSAIALFSGRSMEEMVKPGQRQKLKDELAKDLKERYEGEVMGVYFTDFVTQ